MAAAHDRPLKSRRPCTSAHSCPTFPLAVSPSSVPGELGRECTAAGGVPLSCGWDGMAAVAAAWWVGGEGGGGCPRVEMHHHAAAPAPTRMVIAQRRRDSFNAAVALLLCHLRASIELAPLVRGRRVGLSAALCSRLRHLAALLAVALVTPPPLPSPHPLPPHFRAAQHLGPATWPTPSSSRRRLRRAARRCVKGGGGGGGGNGSFLLAHARPRDSPRSMMP
eukprot:361612-Chlamydomonas_euryale.AAC.6